MSHVLQIRAFSRFYTQFLGLLNHHILESPFSLTESRILFEIAQDHTISAKKLIQLLGVDKGYLSRVLNKLTRGGYLEQRPSAEDKRVKKISLTTKGRELYHFIDQSSSNQMEALIRHLGAYEKDRLASSLKHAQHLLEKKVQLKDITIRDHLLPGDIGFVINSHGEMYKTEYGYSVDFEHYVAKGMVEFMDQYNPSRNGVWICEHSGNKIGFLLLMDRGEAAQLRYFFLFSAYRGIGLGKRLMDLFMKYLHQKGFKSCYLWTTNEQLAAARMYQAYGFRLVQEKPSNAFGKQLVEQKYLLEL